MDAQRPMLSWKIQDSRPVLGNCLSIQVGPTAKWVGSGQGDVWDRSGRNRQFPGCAIWRFCARTEQTLLLASLVWDQNGKASAPSEPSWWRPGFSIRKTGTAKWIGYENPKLRQVRESGAVWITTPTRKRQRNRENKSDFRFHFLRPSLSGAARCM